MRISKDEYNKLVSTIIELQQWKLDKLGYEISNSTKDKNSMEEDVDVLKKVVEILQQHYVDAVKAPQEILININNLEKSLVKKQDKSINQKITNLRDVLRKDLNQLIHGMAFISNEDVNDLFCINEKEINTLKRRFEATDGAKASSNIIELEKVLQSTTEKMNKLIWSTEKRLDEFRINFDQQIELKFNAMVKGLLK